MAPRKKAEQPSLLRGRKATVYVERNGAGIKVEDVDAAEAGLVLADILSALRALTQKYPELIQELGIVPGGDPVTVWEVDGEPYPYERKKRGIGF